MIQPLTINRNCACEHVGLRDFVILGLHAESNHFYSEFSRLIDKSFYCSTCS